MGNSPNPVKIKREELEKTPTHVLVGYKKILDKSMGKGYKRREILEALEWGGWKRIADYKPIAEKWKEINEILEQRNSENDV
jgi:hypothetical protein